MSSLSPQYRQMIFKRDGFRCAYCGRRPPAVTLEVDHIVPRSEGGTSASENLITACRPCNNRKSGNAVELPIAVLPERIPDKLTRRIHHLLELEAAYPELQPVPIVEAVE